MAGQVLNYEISHRMVMRRHESQTIAHATIVRSWPAVVVELSSYLGQLLRKPRYIAGRGARSTVFAPAVPFSPDKDDYNRISRVASIIGTAYEDQCRVLCYCPLSVMGGVQSRFMELRTRL